MIRNLLNKKFQSIFVFMCILSLSPLSIFSSIPMQEIEVLYAPPTAQEFLDLRAAAGMRERKVLSAEKGIPNSLFWITLRNHGKLIGMGRVVYPT